MIFRVSDLQLVQPGAACLAMRRDVGYFALGRCDAERTIYVESGGKPACPGVNSIWRSGISLSRVYFGPAAAPFAIEHHRVAPCGGIQG
jgi:hypothetical protein